MQGLPPYFFAADELRCDKRTHRLASMNTELAPSRPGLLRELGPFMATAVVVGTVIGSGVFKKPQAVAESVPYFGLAAVVWILGGVLALLGASALAEVAVIYPKAGGNYVYLREAYGRLFGFLFGWVEFCIIRSASLAALATIFAESLKDVLKNEAFLSATGLHVGELGFWPLRWLTISVIGGLALVNVLGVRWGGLLQSFVTLIKVLSLVGIAVLPFVAAYLRPHPSEPIPAPQTANLLPLWSGLSALDFAKLGTALVAVLWAYHGWMNAAPVAEEIRNPNRNLPIAFLCGVGTIIVLYLSANLGYCLVMSQDELARVAKDTTVAAVFSERLLGPIGQAVAAAAVMCSVFGALNGNLLVGPRLLYAMGEDGLAPRALGAVHPRFRTPALAILVLAAWSIILVVVGALLTSHRLPLLRVADRTIDFNVPESKSLFDVMTDFAIFGAVIFETLAVSTIFVFRWRTPGAERLYRCWGYPLVPVVYVIILGLVAANMFREQRTEALVGVAFIACGALVYAVQRWRTGPVPRTPTRC
jgi:amino acid transporter